MNDDPVTEKQRLQAIVTQVKREGASSCEDRQCSQLLEFNKLRTVVQVESCRSEALLTGLEVERWTQR